MCTVSFNLQKFYSLLVLWVQTLCISRIFVRNHWYKSTLTQPLFSERRFFNLKTKLVIFLDLIIKRNWTQNKYNFLGLHWPCLTRCQKIIWALFENYQISIEKLWNSTSDFILVSTYLTFLYREASQGNKWVTVW